MNVAQVALHITPKLPVRGKNKPEVMLYCVSVHLPVNEHGELNQLFQRDDYLHGVKLDANWGFIRSSGTHRFVTTPDQSHRPEFDTEREARNWAVAEMNRLNMEYVFLPTNFY